MEWTAERANVQAISVRAPMKNIESMEIHCLSKKTAITYILCIKLIHVAPRNPQDLVN